MNISEIPDKVLADMVRKGCYTRGVDLDESSYLLVLAVPYGPVDTVTNLEGAFEAFHELMSDYDWEERNIQVLRVDDKGQINVQEMSAEVL